MIDSSQNKANNEKDQPKGSKFHQKKTPKPPKKITEKYLYNAGLAYLQRFPASSHHFRVVMNRKIAKSCRFHSEQEQETCAKLLDQTVQKFQELGLLDDTAYTHGMVNSYRRRGLSSQQILIKLSSKGIPKKHVKKVISDFDKEEHGTDQNGDIHAALIFARRKRLGPFDIMKRKEPQKALAVMARAGYSYDIAKKIIEMQNTEIDTTKYL